MVAIPPAARKRYVIDDATADSGGASYNPRMVSRRPQLPSSRSSLQGWHCACRLAVLGLLSLPVAAVAQVAGYRLDPVHTRVMFSISHDGYSQAIGTVSGSEGLLAFDPEDWSSARLSVEVPLQRLDMGDDKWTRAVLASRFLDGARHPLARFVSNRVEPASEAVTDPPASQATDADVPAAGPNQAPPKRARICGTLSLHGVDRPLCLDVTFNQLKRYPLPPFRTTVGFSATATLMRSDFGIDAWKSLVGDEVQLRIEAEAVRDGDALKAIDANHPPAQDAAAPNHDDDASAPPDEEVPTP